MSYKVNIYMGFVKFIRCTFDEYKSLETKDPDALYFIISEDSDAGETDKGPEATP